MEPQQPTTHQEDGPSSIWATSETAAFCAMFAFDRGKLFQFLLLNMTQRAYHYCRLATRPTEEDWFWDHKDRLCLEMAMILREWVEVCFPEQVGPATKYFPMSRSDAIAHVHFDQAAFFLVQFAYQVFGNALWPRGFVP